VNRVEIIGGLVREPELRFLPSGAAVCEFTLAVNGTRWDRDAKAQVVSTVFVACNLWEAEAESFADLGLERGDEIYVLGALDQRVIEKKDGSKESKTRVRAQVVHPTRRRSLARGGREPFPLEHRPDPSEVWSS
jgi:single-strand DNA-binding protein